MCSGRPFTPFCVLKWNVRIYVNFQPKSPEISGKTLNGKINFSGRLQGVPVHRQGVVRQLLNVSDQPQTVLRINIDNSLFHLEKETSMNAMSIVNLDPVFNIKIYYVPNKRYFIQQN